MEIIGTKNSSSCNQAEGQQHRVECFLWEEGKHSSRGLSWVSLCRPVRAPVHGKVGCTARAPEKTHLEGFL